MPEDRGRSIGDNWTLVAHDADTVEFRTGVWNTQTITVRDETHSGKLWSMLHFIREGLGRREVADRANVRTGQVDDLLDSLTDLGIVSEGPQSLLDLYLRDVISLGEYLVPTITEIVIVGDTPIAQEIVRQISEAAPGSTIDQRSSDFLNNFGDESIWEDSLVQERQIEPYRDLAGKLVILATEANDPRRFSYVDAIAKVLGFTWIHATIDGPFLFIGPTIIPGQSATYSDFETRVSINLRERESYLKYKKALASGNTMRATPGVIPSLTGILASFTALEAINYMSCGSNSTLNKVLAMYIPTMEIAYHEVLPLPGNQNGPYANRDAVALYYDAREWTHDPRIAVE